MMNGILRFLGKLLFIVIMLLLLFSYAMFQGGFVSWFLFFGFLPIFFYHLGLLIYPIKKWQVTRVLSHHVCRAGDSISVKVQIKRSVPYPLYYCICEEIFPESLNKIDSRAEKYRFLKQPDKVNITRRIKRIVFPGFRKVIEMPYHIEQIPRGEHRLEAIRIKTGDLFGFVKKEFIFPVEDLLVAYPNERPVQIAERVSSFGQGSITSTSMNLANTNVASGVREYVPGDKFSWIDWKQTAKQDVVMTKEFEREKSTDTILVLDACSFQGMNELAFEATVEIIISLMEAIQKQASQVGFLSIGEEANYFPVHHDPTKKDWIRKFLTQVQPSGDRPFANQLKEEAMKMTSGFIIMIVTTHMDEAFKQSIKQVKQRSKRVIVLFIQSAALISKAEYKIMQQLQFDGVIVNIYTEKQLVQNTLEVSVL